MQRTSSSNVREAVEAEEVSRALEKAPALSAEEEKVLRMRYGARVDLAAPLGKQGAGNTELEDELLVVEMQLLRASRQHAAQLAQAAAPQPSRTKEKIVRALRKKH
jgi:hypothetical protein